MTTRAASHAGSWYSSRSSTLSSELDTWLSQVPSSFEGTNLPIPGARIIIAPHAGYAYSGPAAAYAYKSLSLPQTTTRIFLLGPSHALYLPGCALTRHSFYATPLGNLPIDRQTTEELHKTGKFDIMSRDADENEHSMEMHLPYIYKILSLNFSNEAEYPKIVPILVGNTSPSKEVEYGRLLAPYLKDPNTAFVVSSDFCHWGTRFDYTYYLPTSPAASGGAVNAGGGYSLTRRDKKPTAPAIHESIKTLDRLSMDAVESGKHEAFLRNLKDTGNTVCGRHPIGVVMAAIEEVEKSEDVGEGKGRFKFVRYERSSEVEDITDSSVSYASAYAVL